MTLHRSRMLGKTAIVDTGHGTHAELKVDGDMLVVTSCHFSSRLGVPLERVTGRELRLPVDALKRVLRIGEA